MVVGVKVGLQLRREKYWLGNIIRTQKRSYKGYTKNLESKGKGGKTVTKTIPGLIES